MDGANFQDQTEAVATSREMKEDVNFSTENRVEPIDVAREANTLARGSEGANLPIEDPIEPVATSKEVEIFVQGLEGASFSVEDRIGTIAPSREVKTLVEGTGSVSFPTEDPIETIVPSREAKTLAGGMEGVSFPMEDQIESIATPREVKTVVRDIQGSDFPIEDQIETIAPSREAKTLAGGMEGVSFPMEDQIESVATPREVKTVVRGIQGSDFPIEDRMEPDATSREAKTFVREFEGANFPIENRIEPIAPSRETETFFREKEGANLPIIDRVVPVATSREAKTLVLFGRVGNGKSALGNSILGKKEFLSRISASGVTITCKLGTTRLDDGQVVNVIDTPGLFDLSRGSDTPEYLANEMVNCITLAKDGIHGFILVCSIKTRFSIEEEGVIQSLGQIFGQRIFDYMVVVFTGGDDLDTTFPEYLSTCPPSLQTVLHLCKGRIVLFDNRTKEENQRQNQVQQLMKHIDKIRAENGQPYKSEVFEMMKREALSKHEANTRTTREGRQKQVQHPTVYGAQDPMSYPAQQKSSEGDYGSASSTLRKNKALEMDLKK
ncbi:hypothetical protein MKW92_018509, partial [Papaver armeniacum]